MTITGSGTILGGRACHLGPFRITSALRGSSKALDGRAQWRRITNTVAPAEANGMPESEERRNRLEALNRKPLTDEGTGVWYQGRVGLWSRGASRKSS